MSNKPPKPSVFQALQKGSGNQGEPDPLLPPVVNVDLKTRLDYHVMAAQGEDRGAPAAGTSTNASVLRMNSSGPQRSPRVVPIRGPISMRSQSSGGAEAAYTMQSSGSDWSHTRPSVSEDGMESQPRTTQASGSPLKNESHTPDVKASGARVLMLQRSGGIRFTGAAPPPPAAAQAQPAEDTPVASILSNAEWEAIRSRTLRAKGRVEAQGWAGMYPDSASPRVRGHPFNHPSGRIPDLYSPPGAGRTGRHNAYDGSTADTYTQVPTGSRFSHPAPASAAAASAAATSKKPKPKKKNSFTSSIMGLFSSKSSKQMTPPVEVVPPMPTSPFSKSHYTPESSREQWHDGYHVHHQHVHHVPPRASSHMMVNEYGVHDPNHGRHHPPANLHTHTAQYHRPHQAAPDSSSQHAHGSSTGLQVRIHHGPRDDDDEEDQWMEEAQHHHRHLTRLAGSTILEEDAEGASSVGMSSSQVYDGDVGRSNSLEAPHNSHALEPSSPTSPTSLLPPNHSNGSSPRVRFLVPGQDDRLGDERGTKRASLRLGYSTRLGSSRYTGRFNAVSTRLASTRMASMRMASQRFTDGGSGRHMQAPSMRYPPLMHMPSMRMPPQPVGAPSGRFAPPAGPGMGPGLMLRVGSIVDRGAWSSRGEWSMAVDAEAVCIPTGLQQIVADDIIKVRELGRGCFGSVWLALWCGIEVAMKELHQAVLTDSQQQEVFIEAERLAALRHPCVIAFYGIVTDSPDCYATVVEYVRMGNLRSALLKLRQQGEVTPATRAAIALQAARGMEYLHFQNVVHFDLKCENLLCDLRDISKPVVKIGDLGLSKLTDGQNGIKSKMQGTLPWMAPELFLGGNLPSAESGRLRANSTRRGKGDQAGDQEEEELPWADSDRQQQQQEQQERPPWLEDSEGEEEDVRRMSKVEEERPPWLDSIQDTDGQGKASELASSTTSKGKQGREGEGDEEEGEWEEDDDDYVTNKVDVYSFGVCLWEIWTLGELPYRDLPPESLTTGIMNGSLRPTIPADCDTMWSQLMQDCWSGSPAQRPSFTEIATRLADMVCVYSQQEEPRGGRASFGRLPGIVSDMLPGTGSRSAAPLQLLSACGSSNHGLAPTASGSAGDAGEARPFSFTSDVPSVASLTQLVSTASASQLAGPAVDHSNGDAQLLSSPRLPVEHGSGGSEQDVPVACLPAVMTASCSGLSAPAAAPEVLYSARGLSTSS